MSDCRFRTPLLVWIKPPIGQARVERICDVTTGLAALNRHGLGKYGLSNPEWHIAVEALGQAKIEPTAEKIEAARAASRTLAINAGALLDG